MIITPYSLQQYAKLQPWFPSQSTFMLTQVTSTDYQLAGLKCTQDATTSTAPHIHADKTLF